MTYTCPVCFFSGLEDPPSNYNICDCCGTEFGNDDESVSHAALRERWVNSGAEWYFQNPPAFWNPWLQLAKGGAGLPYTSTVVFAANRRVDILRSAPAPTMVNKGKRTRPANFSYAPHRASSLVCQS